MSSLSRELYAYDSQDEATVPIGPATIIVNTSLNGREVLFSARFSTSAPVSPALTVKWECFGLSTPTCGSGQGNVDVGQVYKSDVYLPRKTDVFGISINFYFRGAVGTTIRPGKAGSGTPPIACGVNLKPGPCYFPH